MMRSLGGKLYQSRGSKPGSFSASLMRTLLFQAVLLSSSEQLNFGTRKVTSISLRLASSMASCRLMVDKPPIDDPHSLAKRVTLNADAHLAG